jgi:GNAT superfamily N-acetyltransferase
MLNSPSSTSVAPITEERLDGAVDILSRAFEGDLLVRYLFPDASSHADGRIRSLFRFTCRERLIRGWPLLGALDGSRLVGVAAVSMPDPPPPPPELMTAWHDLRTSLGDDASERLGMYLDAVRLVCPPQAHLWLGELGIHPAAQHKGHGRALLDAVHALSKAHPRSAGVALDTEKPANVRLYQRLGYGVVAETDAGSLHMWVMFRPNGETKGKAG